MATKLSEGDIASLNITYRSEESSVLHPGSSFTAAVQDIANGLADMSIGPFWVTIERLKMSAFTLPLGYDRIFLVIPDPGSTDSLIQQIQKIFSPFLLELWILIVAVIATAGVLGIWFSERSGLSSSGSNRKIARATVMGKKKSRRACGFVVQDPSMSLPNSTLNFGFGFFILIVVSAYVANLAAFLTSNTTTAVTTMKEAIDRKYRICAHPIVKPELELAWPNADFYYHNEGLESHGVINDYLAGQCDVM
eukprot:scaffold17153_cov65-Cyclotella_meneghiniana.AAC.3